MKRLGQTHLSHMLTLTDIKALTMFMREGETSGKAGSFSSHMDLTSSSQNTPLQRSVLIGSLLAQCHTTGVMTNFNRLPVCCSALRQSTECALFFETSELNKGTDKQPWANQGNEKNLKIFENLNSFISKTNAALIVVAKSEYL